MLAERLERTAVWVAEQLRPSAEEDFATLMHGDPKAMNMFLPTIMAENSKAWLQTCFMMFYVHMTTFGIFGDDG